MITATISPSPTARILDAPVATLSSFAELADNGALAAIPSLAPASADPVRALTTTAASGFAADQTTENR